MVPSLNYHSKEPLEKKNLQKKNLQIQDKKEEGKRLKAFQSLPGKNPDPHPLKRMLMEKGREREQKSEEG